MPIHTEHTLYHNSRTSGEYQCTMCSYFKYNRSHIIENTQDEKASHIILLGIHCSTTVELVGSISALCALILNIIGHI